MSYSASVRLSTFRQGNFECVSTAAIRKAAAEQGLSVREIEVGLLSEGTVPARYLRSIGTFGTEGQKKLRLSSAAVIGCGALGGWIIELLARAGIGRLAVADGDVFEDNNLNRQILCTEASLGQNKALVAAERIRAINASTVPEAHPAMMDETNAAKLLEGCDIAFDALDTLSARRTLLAATQKLGIPLIHGAIAGYWGQVYTALPGDDTLASLWTGEQDRGIEKETGNPPFTPCAVASLQVCEGLKLLLKDSQPLQKGLLWLDLKEMTMDRIG